MRFIEISEGISVKKECIESVEMITDDGVTDKGSRVIMESGVAHESTFPYKTLLQILEMFEKEKDSESSEGIDLSQFSRI